MACIDQFLKNNQRSPKIIQKIKKNINQVSSLHKKEKRKRHAKQFLNHTNMLFI